MNTLKTLARELGSYSKVAKFLGMNHGNLIKYRNKGYLPIHYWEKIAKLKIEGIEYERFIREYTTYESRGRGAKVPRVKKHSGTTANSH